jgi:hypothetical protein
VSKLEENSVRQNLGYTTKEWEKLSPEQRALEIAVSRINRKIEYVKHLKGLGKI